MSTGSWIKRIGRTPVIYTWHSGPANACEADDWDLRSAGKVQRHVLHVRIQVRW